MWLGGCTAIDRLEDRTIEPTSFNQALAQEYRDYVRLEAVQHDWDDADYFARKGLRAQDGAAVAPEELDLWNLPENSLPELSSARARLLRHLSGGSNASYQDLAKAQVLFDCWVEQQEENWQPEHIAACKGEFLELMAKLEKPVTPPPPPVPQPPQNITRHRDYIVYFALDKAQINPEAEAVIREAANYLNPLSDISVRIVGHTDRSGASTYNDALSQRRSLAVQKALLKYGVTPEKIALSWEGEEHPAVPTPDGKPLQENRRVTLRVIGKEQR